VVGIGGIRNQRGAGRAWQARRVIAVDPVEFKREGDGTRRHPHLRVDGGDPAVMEMTWGQMADRGS
jgi:hypothetical protein